MGFPRYSGRAQRRGKRDRKTGEKRQRGGGETIREREREKEKWVKIDHDESIDVLLFIQERHAVHVGI